MLSILGLSIIMILLFCFYSLVVVVVVFCLFVFYPINALFNFQTCNILLCEHCRYNKRESAAFAASRIPACYGAAQRVLHEV